MMVTQVQKHMMCSKLKFHPDITLEISDIQIDESLSKFFDEFVDGSTVGLKLNTDLSPYVDCVGRYILSLCLWFIYRRLSGLGRTPNWREQCCSW